MEDAGPQTALWDKGLWSVKVNKVLSRVLNAEGEERLCLYKNCWKTFPHPTKNRARCRSERGRKQAAGEGQRPASGAGGFKPEDWTGGKAMASAPSSMVGCHGWGTGPDLGQPWHPLKSFEAFQKNIGKFRARKRSPRLVSTRPRLSATNMTIDHQCAETGDHFCAPGLPCIGSVNPANLLIRIECLSAGLETGAEAPVPGGRQCGECAQIGI